MTPPYGNVALSGRSGAGKSTVARYLVDRYGYTHVNTGRICREMCTKLFGSEAKAVLNAVTYALHDIEPHVWVTSALRAAGDRPPFVFDSMRFVQDYDYARAREFGLWRIEAPLALRAARLHARGQEFDPARDDTARAEIELDLHRFDLTIHNEHDDLGRLYAQVDAALTVTERMTNPYGGDRVTSAWR